MSTDTTDRWLVTIVLVALGALLVLPALSMGFGMMGYGMMDWPMGYGPMTGGGLWGSALPAWVPLVGLLARLAFLAVVLGGAYLAYRAVTDSDGDDRALDELRLAYARGDLTDEEYENRRERLERES